MTGHDPNVLRRATHSRRRRVLEPGGALLIGLNAPQNALAEAIALLLEGDDYSSLTVLIAPTQVGEAILADEVWVFARFGLGGFLALIRRISWRRFDVVFNPLWPSVKPVSWLRWFVWPRPLWVNGLNLK